MLKNRIHLLDCTLRDGGYVNNWNWGFNCAKDIINFLVKAKIDVIEVGFLRDVKDYNSDNSVCNTIEELNRLLPSNVGNAIFSAMAMNSNYNINKLTPYSGKGIEMIRITAHDYDIEDGMEFAQEVREKGYKLSINPINIMGYSDNRILYILDQVNKIQPYQFSIVDTFGSMKRRDLDRIVSLVDHNLDRNIRVSLHLHENMSLGCSLAQRFIDKHMERSISIDGSLMGMGRNPGNLPIELIADYLNEYSDKTYDINFLMDAIQDYIAPIKGSSEWGYTPAYFLSARFNLHRNYAEHYLEKGDLTIRDINYILARFTDNKKTTFDRNYANAIYEDYKNNQFDDTADRNKLYSLLSGKDVLVIAPGSSIIEYASDIKTFISERTPVVISINFIPELYKVDFAFFSNNKRFSKIDNISSKIIITSNLKEGNADYQIDYNSLSGAFDQGCNSYILLLKLLKQMKVKRTYSAGADGYKEKGINYYSENIRSYIKRDNKFNISVADAIRKLDIKLEFLTPSAYDGLK